MLYKRTTNSVVSLFLDSRAGQWFILAQQKQVYNCRPKDVDKLLTCLMVLVRLHGKAAELQCMFG